MKSWKKMSREERRAWDSHVDARIRQLRELVARREAELRAKRLSDPGYGRPPGPARQ